MLRTLPVRFPRSLAASAVPTQGTVPPPGAAWVCWGRLPLPLGVTAVRPPFLNSGPASPSGRLAGHRHGLKFVWVPLTVDPWYPAGRPGACSPAGGFEVLLGGRVAPPRGARRNTPGSPCGSWPSCLRRLPLSFALWWPLLAAPPPAPSLAGSPLSGSSASSYCVFPGAQSARRGRGHPPRPPCLAARTASSNTGTPQSYFIAVYRSQSMSPGRPPAPAPAEPESSAGGARSAAGPGSADAGGS